MAFFNQIQLPLYVTAQQLRRVLGTQVQSTNDDDILTWQADMISRRIEEYCNRRFYIFKQTYNNDWPGTSFVMYLPEDLHTLTTLTNGNGEVIPDVTGTTTNIFYYPNFEYPRYKIELAINCGKVFLFVGTPQQAITLSGLWGFPAITNTGQHNITVGATVQDATGQTISQTTLLTQTGKFQVGHTLMIEDEFQIVQDVATGVTNDTLTVLRGACGTTAVAHAKDTVVKLEIYNSMIVNAAYRFATYLYRQKDSAITDQVGFTGQGQLTVPTSMPADIQQMLKQFIRRSH